MEPPDPIPNSEVKRTCADGSVHLACESRSSPGFLPRNPRPQGGGFFLRAIATRQYSSAGLETDCMRKSVRQASRWGGEAKRFCRVCGQSRGINLKGKRINLERMSPMQRQLCCESERHLTPQLSQRTPGRARQRVDDCQRTRMRHLDWDDEMGFVHLGVEVQRGEARVDRDCSRAINSIACAAGSHAGQLPTRSRILQPGRLGRNAGRSGTAVAGAEVSGPE